MLIKTDGYIVKGDNNMQPLKIQIIGNAASGKTYLAHLLYRLLSALNYEVSVIDDKYYNVTESFQQRTDHSFKYGHLPQSLIIETVQDSINDSSKNILSESSTSLEQDI